LYIIQFLIIAYLGDHSTINQKESEMTNLTRYLMLMVIVTLFTSCSYLQLKPTEPPVDQRTLQDITMSTIIFVESVKSGMPSYEASYSDSTYEVSIHTSGMCFGNDFATGGAIIIECADEFGNNDGVATTSEVNDLFGSLPMMAETSNGITLPPFIIEHVLNGDEVKALQIWNKLQLITEASESISLP
jgi:hypothetical protein